MKKYAPIKNTRKADPSSPGETKLKGKDYDKELLDATDTEYAPWYIVRSDDKRRARLNCIAHLLRQFPHEPVPRPRVRTSMGAIVGGLYASGLSPEEIEREIRDMDWDDVLEDQPPRPERQFRRKRDDDIYLVKKQLGHESGKLQLPLGYIQGQKLDLE
ncbi:MAG: hypothetical protein ACREA0_09315, partial [bacterium]